MHFVLFRSICDHFVALKNSRQNGPNWCKSSSHEVTSEFFATNAPDPQHWTLNPCFGAFHTILMHLGPFGWLAKLDGKRAELMQKFVPRSCVRIFRNECTRSTTLDPKLMFWCVSYYLSAFGTVFCPTTLSAKRVNWGKSSCHEVASEFFATNEPDPPHWTLNTYIWCVLYYLDVFGTVWLPYKT